MRQITDLVNHVGLTERTRKSRLPARLDFLQSASGLFLALFMWLHMLFVSSILLGKDAMWTVTKFFEGYFFFGESYPILVSGVAAVVFFIFIIHAALAMRKFPINYRQYRTYRAHMDMMHHEDTTLWFIQVYTGFAMFFLGSVHLYIIMTNPANIGPYESADRIVSGWMWPLYLLLLLAVEFHGSIGLYRLAVKWGWFEGKNPVVTRKNLKKAKWCITAVFLVLGLTTLAAYIKIGLENRPVGMRYVPSYLQSQKNILDSVPAAH